MACSMGSGAASPRRSFVTFAVLAATATGCGQLDETCTTIGRAGGLLQSADSVLSIAIQPESLDADVEFCVGPPAGAQPPESYGQAYRVRPTMPLAYGTSVSYRFALPSNTSETNIGYISADDFAMGKGEWRALEDCRIEHPARQVRCAGRDIQPFYTLLDGLFGNTNDSIADTGSTGDVTDTDATAATTLTTTMGMPTVDPDTGMETDPTAATTVDPIDYPPECDSLAMGPFDVYHAGQWFEPWPGGLTSMGGPLGAEDMAPDGNGGFIGRNVNGLVRIDVTGLTIGDEVPDADPGDFASIGITRTDVTVTPDFASTSTLGIRYTSMGDIAMLQLADRAIDLLHPDGSHDRILMVPFIPNAVYADADGAIWYSEFSSGNIRRYDLATEGNTLIANLPTADGVIYDELRGMAFFVRYDQSQLWRISISGSGMPIGQPTMVADLTGFSDGITLDVCGNLYVVDQGGVDGPSGTSRIDRVFMTDGGDLIQVEELAAGIPTELANGVFATGGGELEHVMFFTGQPGDVYYMDVQITGAPAPIAL